ncbi:MAG: class I SAM-dependent methyltransferase [Spirochaetota bacterium]|nr:class I SAM-dependent methyltransferase [Spirochaetota bacterium]
MSSYDMMAERYEELFPPSRSQIDFIDGLIRRINGTGNRDPEAPSTLRILDIGCGTGALASALIDRAAEDPGRVMHIDAVDLNVAMIERGRKLHGKASNLSFRQMDMRDIAGFFPEKSFDAALCLGNTLVHLDNPESMEDFLQSALTVLKPGGLLVLQILNYDYIVGSGISALPPISIRGADFYRRYETHEDGVHFFFITELVERETAYSTRSSSILYPLGKAELLSILTSAGFESFQLFGSFDGASLTDESLPLIVTARAQPAGS